MESQCFQLPNLLLSGISPGIKRFLFCSGTGGDWKSPHSTLALPSFLRGGLGMTATQGPWSESRVEQLCFECL